ncbi:hypothetical protein C8F01DRAFT_1125368 [Mycena amicta]|nr:hypothetical protein C8F01DRAFT_1125368 [Mycena amicta]
MVREVPNTAKQTSRSMHSPQPRKPLKILYRLLSLSRPPHLFSETLATVLETATPIPIPPEDVVEQDSSATQDSSAASIALQSTESESLETAMSTPVQNSGSSGTDATIAIEQELSAASIVLQSAHGMESAVLDEILDDAQDAQAPLQPTEPLSAPQTTPIDAKTLEEPEEDFSDSEFLEDLGIAEEEPDEVEEEEDFSSFLEGLGIGEEEEEVYEEEEIEELSPAELIALQRQQEQEQREAKTRSTKEKRADLEGRMARSLETLGRQVEGERQTAPKNAGADAQSSGGERLDKWYNVVEKVEEKISDRIQMSQGLLHEFRQGMAIIEELKGQCNQAQADVGLDLSWLDDVTYQDWQVYHDIARMARKFQAEASEIQAGTPCSPTKGSVMTQLAVVEGEMAELVNQLGQRLYALKTQAEAALRPTEAPIHEEL